MDDWVTDGDIPTGGGYLDDMSADERQFIRMTCLQMQDISSGCQRMFITLVIFLAYS